jgi:hypothetical protein
MRDGFVMGASKMGAKRENGEYPALFKTRFATRTTGMPKLQAQRLGRDHHGTRVIRVVRGGLLLKNRKPIPTLKAGCSAKASCQP